MGLANGANKSYTALAQAAPSYQKYNALTQQYMTAFQIDPQNDLGRLDSVIIPPHADVRVTVTFAVPDQIADPTSNQRVRFR